MNRIKWKDMTPKQLERVSQDLSDHAHDLGIDREHMIEETGFDVVEATECAARRLDREAKRRERKASFGLMEEVIIESEGWTLHVRHDGKQWHYQIFVLGKKEPTLTKRAGTLCELLYVVYITIDDVVLGNLDKWMRDMLKLRRDARKRRAEQVKASFKEAVGRHAAEVVPSIIPADVKAHGETFSENVMRAMSDARAKDWIRDSAGVVEVDGVVVGHATDITIKGNIRHHDFIGDDVGSPEDEGGAS